VITFSNGMDARDTALYRSAFADEVELDIPPRATDVITLSGRVRADQYAMEVVRLLSGWEATQHVSTNHLITVDGDQGTCVCYVFATHYLPNDSGAPWLEVGSRYTVTARRLPDVGWRIVKLKSTHLWSRWNKSLWEEISRRIRANL